MRCLDFILPCLLAAEAYSQVTHSAPSPGLDQGVVAAWKGGAFTRGGERAVPLGDFSICVQSGADSLFDMQADGFELHRADKTVVFKMATPADRQIVLRTPPLQSAPRSIVVSIRRDPRQALAGLWIDGVEMASVAVAPGEIKWEPSATKIHANEVRLYDRALTRPEIIEFSQQEPLRRPAPFAGEFAVMDGEVISVLGGTEAVGLVDAGWFETALMSFASGRKVSVRDLAWEADTVLRQDRPMNFGDLTQQLQRTRTTMVMLMFGRQDCIEMDADGAPAFHEALEKIVQTCSAQTQRLVIIGPVPFEKKEPPLPDLTTKNVALRDYNEALRALAENHQGLFVDVLAEWPKTASRWTTDGLTMSDAGHRVLADLIALHLWNGAKSDATAAPLRKTIIEKNKLWHDYWRPSNWAFLHGDRTAQPSSRDHLNPGVRWFPAELEKYRELITEKEKEIWKQAAEQGGRLP